VRDGDSFVIGGLTQDEDLTTKTKVPLLGDIPILGQAFRTDKQTRTKTELYIIVTPHIVHPVGTLARSATEQPPYGAGAAPTAVILPQR
jgi:general secretion pathway protein D